MFPLSFEPMVDSKCNHITHSFLWKAPFLMIWQPVDTEAFQKKISIPLPTASAGPSDKWHLSFCHRQGAQTRDFSDVWLTRTGNQLKRNSKRTDQDIVGVLLSRPHLRDRECTSLGVWRGQWNYVIKTRGNMYLCRSGLQEVAECFGIISL